MVVSNCKSYYGGLCAGGCLENAQRQASLAQQMVKDLERFLGSALAEEVSQQRNYRWPLRYNSVAGASDQRRLNEE